ncbi:hypothetical protein C8J57DRAFT_1180 [Mycena rebaudengoi]|nr:hypothetical protein C8J57DRAFT_1180 [Mycena rebaudengoi]
MESSGCCLHCVLAKPSRLPLPQPPTNLSTSYDLPEESEVRATHESIHVGRTRISEIDHEIRRLEGLLKQLRRERTNVLHDIEQHLAVISPMRQLPSDVLGEIFSWTLPRFDDNIGFYYSTDISMCPWVLTHVCRRWRHLAISLPSLWGDIHVRSDYIPALAALGTELERSGSYPLTIQFSSTNIEAFKLILNHSERWHTIDLWLREWMVPLLDVAAGHLPLLRSLTYDGNCSSSCTAFESATGLVTVRAPRNAPLLPIPYAQLVRLSRYTPQTLLAAAPLRMAHNLTELTLFGDPPSEDIGNPIELPRLHMLRIKNGLFLDYLVLPALDDIFIHQKSFALISLVHRSSCTLRKLGTLDSETLAFLEHIPTLSELLCQDFRMEAVSRLIVPANIEPNLRPLCPKLRSLYIHCNSGRDTCSTITQLMESRHQTTACSPLSLYVYENSWELTPNATKTLSALLQRGMDIKWSTVNHWGPHVTSLYDAYP